MHQAQKTCHTWSPAGCSVSCTTSSPALRTIRHTWSKSPICLIPTTSAPRRDAISARWCAVSACRPRKAHNTRRPPGARHRAASATKAVAAKGAWPCRASTLHMRSMLASPKGRRSGRPGTKRTRGSRRSHSRAVSAVARATTSTEMSTPVIECTSVAEDGQHDAMARHRAPRPHPTSTTAPHGPRIPNRCA